MRIKKALGKDRMALMALIILAVSAEITSTSAQMVATTTQSGTAQHITSTQAVTTKPLESEGNACLETTSAEYNGTENRTESGLICQRWSVTTPHSHNFADSTSFPEGSSAAAANYCRDPDGYGTPWCYTVDYATRWEECDINICPVCSGNEESCLDDHGYLVCVPHEVCDIVYAIVTFKIDGVSFDLVNAVFAFMKDTFKTIFAMFLKVDKDSIMDSFSIFRGSLGVNIPVTYTPDIPYKLDEVRHAIESGTKTIELQGLPVTQNPFPVVADSLDITVIRVSAESTFTSPQTIAANTQTSTVQNITSTQVVITQLPVCSENEKKCYNDDGYLFCAPKKLCNIEYVIVTYKIANVIYDFVKPAFDFFKGAFKEAFANFLKVDKNSIMDNFSIFRGSLGVNIPITYSSDLPYKLEGVRQEIQSNTKTTDLDGLLTGIFPVKSDSFRITAIRETGGGDCYITTSRQYVGTSNLTKSGLTCQRWDVQTPHSHGFTSNTSFPDGSVTAVENYCRDPDGVSTPWCYTINEATRWEKCNITRCKACSGNEESCLYDNGTEVCVPQNHCDILYVKVTFKIDNLNYDSFYFVYLFSKGVYKTKFAEFLEVDSAFIQDVTIFKASANALGVTLTIDHYKDLPQKIDVARLAIDDDTHIILQSGTFNIIRDSFHITVTRDVEMVTSDSLLTPTTDVIGTTTTLEPEGDDCFETTPAEYDGTVNHTKSGLACQRWDAQAPNNHSNTSFPEGSVTAAENYCRDPDGEGTPWCYTVDNTTSWEECNIKKCRVAVEPDGDDCFETTSSEYEGTVNRTKSGLTCQRWDVQTPHNHSNTENTSFPDGSVTAAENYCRDPDGEGTLWCYTVDNTTRLEKCDINRCKGNPSCHSDETTCLDDFGYLICVPQKVCDIFSVILSFKIDANYKIFRWVIHKLIRIVKVFVAHFLHIDLDSILNLDVSEGSVKVDVELKSSSELLEAIEGMRQDVDKGDTKVDLIGTEYKVMPNTLQVTVNRGNTSTSFYSDKPASKPMMSTYMPENMTTLERENEETVTVPVSTYMPDENTTAGKEDKETVVVPVSTNMPESITTSYKETVAVKVSTYMPDENTTSYKDKETVSVPTYMPGESTTSDIQDNETAVVPVSTYMPETTTTNREDEETVAVLLSTYMPDKNTTSDKEDTENVTVLVSTYIPDAVTTSEVKDTVAVTVSTNTPEDMTASDAKDKETDALTASTKTPEEITTSDTEDKETAAVTVSTNIPGVQTTSDAEDKETVPDTVSTSIPEKITSDEDDKETVAVMVSTSIPEKITTSEKEDKTNVAETVSTNMPEEMTTSGIEDKETVTTTADKDGPTNSTVPGTESIVDAPDRFPLTTKNYRIQTEGISGATPLQWPLTVVFYTAMVIRAL